MVRRFGGSHGMRRTAWSLNCFGWRVHQSAPSRAQSATRAARDGAPAPCAAFLHTAAGSFVTPIHYCLISIVMTETECLGVLSKNHGPTVMVPEVMCTRSGCA